MSEFKVTKYTEMKLNDPTAVVGFPTIGLVGSILASYLIKKKEMTILAGITSEDLPPYSMIIDGKPYPQIRIFGYKAKDENECDLVVITSEMTPKPESCYELGTVITDIIEKLNVKETICLEGVAKFEGADTVICGTNDVVLEKGRAAELRVLSEGLVRGLTGTLLCEGKNRDLDITAMMCPANANMPDPRASADLVAPLTKLIPGLNLDTADLYKEADDIENKIRDEIQHDQMKDDVQQIYG